jgi:hypothetical protein
MRHLEMSEFDARQLLVTESVSVWNVVCPGRCRHESVEESAETTHLVFPYRGVYVRHVGGAQTVAQANHVVFLNENELYRVSHPVAGGDATVSIGIAAPTLQKLAPGRISLRH